VRTVIAAAAPGGPPPAGQRLQLVVDLHDLLDERGVGHQPGVARVEAGGVGQQDQQVGAHELGDQRGQAVVVPHADLVVGDRVVLVDDRYHAQLQQPAHRLSGPAVLREVDEVQRGQQDLAADEAVVAQRPVVGPHQPALTHRRDRLERRELGGADAVEPERRLAGGDGARGDDDDLVAAGPYLGHLGAQLGDARPVDVAGLVGQRRAADLGDDDHDRRTGRSAGRFTARTRN
jgi:hypothetical protein